jgi:tryptophan 2,3-dioxygenase
MTPETDADQDMLQPVPWQDDPACGHQVKHAYQTHYCTYVRVPRLLSLQSEAAGAPGQDRILFTLAIQAIELWFKVMRVDLEAAVRDLEGSQGGGFEPAKLFNRCFHLVRLLDAYLEWMDAFVVPDLDLPVRLKPSSGAHASWQFDDLQGLAIRLASFVTETADPHNPSAGSLKRFALSWEAWATRFAQRLGTWFESDPHGEATYAGRFQIESLLSLQDGVKADWTAEGEPPQAYASTPDVSPDELMFIVVHQVFELWFRAQLHDLDIVMDRLTAEPPDLEASIQRLRRVVSVQTILVDQIQIPATMLPQDFLKFRSQARKVDGVTQLRGLSPASGTESYQFREIEIVAGLKTDVAYQEFLDAGQQMHIRFLTPKQEERMKSPSLAELLDGLLTRSGVSDLLAIFSPADEDNPHRDLAILADLLLAFDQGFQLWRFHHLTMVQSMIGRKSGTGFLGPEYLKETVGMGMQGEDDRLLRTPQIRPRFFESLWEVRTRMQAQQGDRNG